MLRSGADLRSLDEIDTCLIVLMDCAVYDRGACVKRYDTPQFTNETNERNDVARRLRECHIFALGGGKSYFRL